MQCVNNEVVTVDCPALNRACGWENDAFACVIPSGATCDDVPESSSCDGDTLNVCINGLSIQVNCDTIGQICAWDGDEFTCGDPAQGACKPLCQGAECGPDGCGGSCGTCPDGSECAANGECVDCGICEDPQHPCGDVPEQGVCAGNTLHQCVADVLVETDCTLDNRVCGFEAQALGGAGGFDCIPATGGECADLPATGSCSGNTLTECVNGAASTQDCTATNEICGWDGDSFDCIPSAACTPLCSGKECGDDGCGGSCGTCDPGLGCASNGECHTCDECTIDADCDDANACTADVCGADGNCANTALANGTPCDFPEACGGGQCIAGICEGVGDLALDDCGNVPPHGLCDGHTLKVCANGQIVETNCLSLGRACGWDEDDNAGLGGFDCITQDTICAGVPDSGICDGNLLTWCDTDTGQIIVEDCTTYGEKCQWQGSFFCCHPPELCVPNCLGKVCGDDGCGGSCGECPADEACTESGTCLPCVEQSNDPQTQPPGGDEPDQEPDPQHPADVPTPSGCANGTAPSPSSGALFFFCLALLAIARRRAV